MSVFSKVITSIFGKKSDKDLKSLSPIVNQINQSFQTLDQLTDEDLKNKFTSIKNTLIEKIQNNKEKLKKQNLDYNLIDDKLYDIEKIFLEENLVEVFAIVKDAARRLLGTKYALLRNEFSELRKNAVDPGKISKMF